MGRYAIPIYWIHVIYTKKIREKGYSYLNALEETVELAGMTVSDVIKKNILI